MGTVEWSELLRWVPRGPQEDPGPDCHASSQQEAAAPVETIAQTPAAPAKCEPGKLTLASL